MSLLNRMVRLAHQHPELRQGILGLIQKAADFDPEDIAREEAGALESEADEAGYMSSHFTQQIFRELSDRQEGGDLGASPVEAPRAPSPGKQARLKTLRRLRELRAAKKADFNPEDIGREVGGPLRQDNDEAFMGQEFTQQRFRDLREHQEAGELSQVQTEEQGPQPGKQARLAHLRRLRELRASRG